MRAWKATTTTTTTSGAALPEAVVEAGSQTDRVVAVLSRKGLAEVGRVTLPGDIFDMPFRRDILHRMVVYHLAKRRQGTHKTKSRSEVRGGGKKPWRQKGTGRARAGSIRSPIFRGGGHTFAKRPRDYAIKLTKKYRRLGLRTALSHKLASGKLFVLDELKVDDAKTKEIVAMLDQFRNGRRSFVLCDEPPKGFKKVPKGRAYGRKQREWEWTKLHLAARNVADGVQLLPSIGLNVVSPSAPPPPHSHSHSRSHDPP